MATDITALETYSYDSTNHAEGSIGTRRTSQILCQLLEVHQDDNFDRRLARDWTGRSPKIQSWDLEAGVARCVLSVINSFIETPPLRLHGMIGENKNPPTFDTLQTSRGITDIPKDAIFFLEDTRTGERIVLKIEDTMRGDYCLSIDAENPSQRIQDLRDYTKQRNYLRGHCFNIQGDILKFDDVEFDAVVLTRAQEMAIERHVLGFATRFRELKERGARLSRGLLLEGVPGCGKSLLLRSLANRLSGFSVCLASPSQLGQYCNSVDVLKDLINMTSPCAVFIEEIDMFASDRRSMGGNHLGMGELMQLMDGLSHIPGVLWIATTNRPEAVETALADRPGRFDRRIVFGPLDSEPRNQLVDRLVSPQTLTDEAKKLVMSCSDGWTGAQLRDLFETLRLISDRDVFDATTVTEALEDCAFESSAGFGFGRSCRIGGAT